MDRKFSLELAPKLTAISSGDVDMRPSCTSTDQYNINGCAGNAAADSFEILNVLAGNPPVQLSRLFVYSLARNQVDSDGDGKSDLDKDEGTYIRLCFDVIWKYGICREDLPAGKGGWPYDTSKVHVLPDLMAMRSAVGHKLHSFYRIEETGQSRIDAMLQALRAHHPIVFGTEVDEAFEDLSDATPWVRTQPSKGGHAMVVVGYIDGQGFIVKNSWGTGWGVEGFCFMKPDVFLAPETVDLWVPTMGVMFRS